MGTSSLILAAAGIVTTLLHYANHSAALGAVTAVLLIASFVLGLIGMKQQEKSGGVVVDKVNPALLGHGISSVVLLVCGIMCIIANVR